MPARSNPPGPPVASPAGCLGRRKFLAATAVGSAGGLMIGSSGGQMTRSAFAAAKRPVELRIGAIGMRYQGTVIAREASTHGRITAIADVDADVLDQARASFGSRAKIYENYQDMLTRDDVDVVTIGSPDHWHVKMALDACRAGKDVYVEKPLSLTIDEGKLLREVAAQTGRIVQVGSWQRSDHRFRLAVEMVRGGRIGELQRVDVVLGNNLVGGPFSVRLPPPKLNWDLWQGQAADVPYIPERCHYTFRGWYQYAGGQVTDWGAHHLDIAQWAIGEDPIAVQSKGTLPSVEDGYNVPIDFYLEYQYPGGVVMTVADRGRSGILFTGTRGRIFVNRGTLDGAAVEELNRKPLRREDFAMYDHDNLNRPERVGKIDAIVNHMGNFFDCVLSRQQPISDVQSQHRSATTCHLGNLSLRLQRPLRWDAQTESFPDDQEANSMMSRPQRAGFEVT